MKLYFEVKDPKEINDPGIGSWQLITSQKLHNQKTLKWHLLYGAKGKGNNQDKQSSGKERRYLRGKHKRHSRTLTILKLFLFKIFFLYRAVLVHESTTTVLYRIGNKTV